jgi:hypothetical protein
MDVKTLSAVLGHVSSAVSIDVYAHTTTKIQQEAAIAIDRHITKSKALMFMPNNIAPPPEGSCLVVIHCTLLKSQKIRKISPHIII